MVHPQLQLGSQRSFNTHCEDKLNKQIPALTKTGGDKCVCVVLYGGGCV